MQKTDPKKTNKNYVIILRINGKKKFIDSKANKRTITAQPSVERAKIENIHRFKGFVIIIIITTYFYAARALDMCTKQQKSPYKNSYRWKWP